MEDWKNKFREKFTHDGVMGKLSKSNIVFSVKSKAVENFITDLLDEVKKEIAEERKYVGKLKREWYTKGFREGQTNKIKEIKEQFVQFAIEGKDTEDEWKGSELYIKMLNYLKTLQDE